MFVALRNITLVLVVALVGCGQPAGRPCRVEGMSFFARSNCRHRCLQYREIICPDGTAQRPSICSGRMGCEPRACGDGLICHHVRDPFEDESYCIPEDLCGRLPAAEVRRWEEESRDAADRLRAEWAAKMQRRKSGAARPIAPEAMELPQ